MSYQSLSAIPRAFNPVLSVCDYEILFCLRLHAMLLEEYRHQGRHVSPTFAMTKSCPAASGRPSYEGRRCLVPASSYCEPIAASLRSGIGSRSAATMTAGLDVYSFMTTAPNALTDSIYGLRDVALRVACRGFRVGIRPATGARISV